MPNEKLISIDNVFKKYGTFPAVNGISLEVNKGEIFGFLGINGAGKTTTLKMLAGILQPSSGTIELQGHSVTDNPIEAKAVAGYIPDRPYLYPKLTGRELLYFVADLYSIKERLEDRIDSLLDKYGLTEWQYELIEGYSHGMKQRLATCAALVHDPSILIIDEPMVGLDPHGAKLFKELMKSYAEDGKAIFLSTHSLNVAEELAHRMAIIHKGEIIASGSLEEIREHTENREDGEDLESLFIKLTTIE